MLVLRPPVCHQVQSEEARQDAREEESRGNGKAPLLSCTFIRQGPHCDSCDNFNRLWRGILELN